MPIGRADQEKLAQLGLDQRQGAVVVVDLVASVRQIEQDEFGTIARWVNFVRAVKSQLLTQFSGRLVKSLGDGLLIEFPDVQRAIHASLAIMQAARRPDADLSLRIGVEAGTFLSDAHDIYGSMVNRAARLMVRAGPGQIIVSQAVRNAAFPMPGLHFSDAGIGKFKHAENPVRAFIMQPAHSFAVDRPPAPLQPALMVPTLAIFPFESRHLPSDVAVLGDILCEELINGFVQSHCLNVIARQSAEMFRAQGDVHSSAREALNAHYVLTGSIVNDHGGLLLRTELVDTGSGLCIAAERCPIKIRDDFAYYRDALQQLRALIWQAIHGHELELNRQCPLEKVSSHAMLIMAIDKMHQLTLPAFEEAERILDAVMEREPSHMASLAWKAHWFHMRIQQGWSSDVMKDMRSASDLCKKAVDRDPESSLALAVGGLMATVMERRYDLGERYSEQAVALSPNDPRAWLYHGAVHIFTDDGVKAVQATMRAKYLSPLDPYEYIFDSVAASAYFVKQDYESCCIFAERAYRQNKRHASTLRIRAAALHHTGRQAEAQAAAAEMMQQEPGLTISGWKQRSPAADASSGRDLCMAFAALGVPA